MPTWVNNLEPVTSFQEIEDADQTVIIPDFICHSCLRLEDMPP